MKIHVVKKQETLRDIAAHYGVEEAALIRANQLSSPARLPAGMSLIIPGDRPAFPGSMETCAFAVRSFDMQALPYFTYLCPYSHSFSPAGQLLPPDSSFSTAELRSEGCAPLLCLANLGTEGGFSSELAHGLFTEDAVQEALLSELMAKLGAGGYYGVHLGFNYLFPFDRDNYSRFVSRLSDTLHKAGFMLSVELAPKEGSALSAALDYTALGSAADRVSLMFCRWAHAYSPPQAPAPMRQLRFALSYAAERIAPEKLLLGISGSGFDWRLPWHQGDMASALSNARAMELAISQSSEIKFDAASQAPWFLYTDAEKKRHIVFFEDGRSLYNKLKLVDEFSLAGISLYTADRLSPPLLHVMEGFCSTEKLL